METTNDLMMTRVFRDEWTTALRSGRYPQAVGRLCRTGPSHPFPCFCVFGVRAELDVEKGLLFRQDDRYFLSRYDADRFFNYSQDGGHINSLSYPMISFLHGVVTKRWGVSDSLIAELMAMNDHRISFQKLADFLDRQPVKD